MMKDMYDEGDDATKKLIGERGTCISHRAPVRPCQLALATNFFSRNGVRCAVFLVKRLPDYPQPTKTEACFDVVVN